MLYLKNVKTIKNIYATFMQTFMQVESFSKTKFVQTCYFSIIVILFGGDICRNNTASS